MATRSTARALFCGCLFLLAPTVRAAGLTKGEQKLGSWTFSSEADPMSDHRSSSLEVQNGGKSFSFQCDAPGPGSIYPIFGSDQYLGGDGGGYGRRKFMLRFDADQPLSPTWVYKGPIAFIPHDHAQALALMKRAVTAQKLAVRAITYESGFVDAEFQLTGSEAALTKLVEACQDGSDLTALGG